MPNDPLANDIKPGDATQSPVVHACSPTAVEWLVLLLGAAVSVVVVRAALGTALVNWRMDADVGAMPIVLLAPSGVAWLGTACLICRRSPRRWAAGTWLWPAVAATSAAWAAVFLDGGTRLGVTGRMVSGVTAMFGPPCVALAAIVIGVVSLFRRLPCRDWTHWSGMALGLVAGAGWILFLWILLPLQF